MNRSTSCFGKTSGKPVAEYDSIVLAKAGANYAKEKFGQDMVPYQCGACRKWHLSPSARQTEILSSSECDCVDGSGHSKKLYATKEGATRRAGLIYKDRGERLTAYPCTKSHGYHLTSSSGPHESQYERPRTSKNTNRKSQTCFGKSGQPLTEYSSLEEAESGAEFLKERYGYEMFSYECDGCYQWHLSGAPKKSAATQNAPIQNTGRKSHICKGKTGQPLTYYECLDDAESGAEYANERYGNDMVPYQCKRCSQWHLAPRKRYQNQLPFVSTGR